MATAVLRHSSRDTLLIALAFVHGALLVTIPSAPLIAIGLWWNANTIAHNFLHLPFFRSRNANRTFSVYLSLLLGVPQTLWRERHMAHHANRPFRLRWSRQLAVEAGVVSALWLFLASLGPAFFFGTWLPGWACAMVLCTLQGHYEHVRGTVSHYGAFYNLLFFNDGYHVEHHARPGLHWTRLPSESQPDAEHSRWPAVLRWIETVPLNALERLVLHSRLLQRWVLDRHTRAFDRILEETPDVKRVTIVGGGLFPRTALVLRRLLPGADITVIDRSAHNISNARRLLDGTVRWVEASYTPALCNDADLVVVPLAFVGDRPSFYAAPPAPIVAVHDWIWHRAGDRSAIISPLLLKRLNVVQR
jgi:hypothetical protein